jgi:hypothetical protein
MNHCVIFDPAGPLQPHSPTSNDSIGHSEAIVNSANSRVSDRLRHFNDDDERDRYIAYCRTHREAALARWNDSSSFCDIGEADFWGLEIESAEESRS